MSRSESIQSAAVPRVLGADCPVTLMIDILSKKWTIPIICALNHHGVMRFGQLSRAIDGVTSMMLTQSLRDLQGYGIVARNQYNEMPVRVEYSLTDIGKEMVPSILNLSRWGIEIMGDNVRTECEIGECMVKLEHEMYVNQELLQKAKDDWDIAYENLYKQIEKSDADYRDPIDQLILLAKYFLKEITKRGEEFSRLANIYYIWGEEKSEDITSRNRKAFVVLDTMLCKAREQEILTDNLTNEEIIDATFRLIHGINSYWELERGSYDIVERNEKFLAHFFNSFRK